MDKDFRLGFPKGNSLLMTMQFHVMDMQVIFSFIDSIHTHGEILSDSETCIRILKAPLLVYFDKIFFISNQKSVENTNYLFLKYGQALNNPF